MKVPSPRITPWAVASVTSFARAFPRLADHIRTHYTVRGSFAHDGGTPIDVAFRNGDRRETDLDMRAWTCRRSR